MPPRKTKRRGRQLVDDVTDGAAPAAEPVSAAYLDTVLSELDRDVEARCKMIKRETEDAQQQLALEFKTLLFCLPKHIREMPMSQFANEFGGRVDEVVKKTVAAQMRKLPPRTEVKLAPCAGSSAQATALCGLARKVAHRLWQRCIPGGHAPLRRQQGTMTQAG